MIQDQSCADLDPDSPEHSNLWHSHTCNKITKKGLWSPPPPANTITPWTLPQKNFFWIRAWSPILCFRLHRHFAILQFHFDSELLYNGGLVANSLDFKVRQQFLVLRVIFAQVVDGENRPLGNICKFS